MNIPNLITTFRLVLTGVFLVASSMDSWWGAVVGLGAFIIAAVSDFLDGYLARKLNLVTSFGKLMDPLADKILVLSAFVVLSSRGLCPNWVTCVILAREFLVTGLRQIALERGEVLAADRLGKWKTTLQITFIILCLTIPVFGVLNVDNQFVALIQMLSLPHGVFYELTLWGSLGLTVISGMNYFWSTRHLLLE